MPKRARELSSLEVKRLNAPGLHAVGGVSGLFLRVKQTGSRSWIVRVKAGNRRRDIGLGAFPDVPLADARSKARDIREQIRNGIDPVAERNAARDALVAAQARELTFEQAARKCHAAKESEFRNAKHRKDWISALERHAFPVIGERHVAEIQLPDVLRVLEPIWTTKTETATRVRQRMESVLTWATVSGYRSGENPARWDGNLREVLPNPSRIRKVKHHRAVPWQKVPEFVQKLREREGTAAKALEFAILTAARSSEVRLATWEEIDLTARVWTVPGDRIKAGKPHTVPLSDRAVEILENIERRPDSPFVFPAIRGGAMSDVAPLAVMRRMNTDATPHGFRSSFKDWARNRTAYPDEVSELALAHVNSDATRAAYARDELLPQRTRMMAEWAKFVNTVEPAGDVTSIRRAAE